MFLFISSYGFEFLSGVISSLQYSFAPTHFFYAVIGKYFISVDDPNNKIIYMMKVKVESEKVGLKLNTQKTKVMTSGPI